MLAPAFPWEFGMCKAPLGWKSNAELLPTEETLPMPWALLVLTVNPMSPAAGGSVPRMGKAPRSGLACLPVLRCCCCQSELWGESPR